MAQRAWRWGSPPLRNSGWLDAQFLPFEANRQERQPGTEIPNAQRPAPRRRFWGVPARFAETSVARGSLATKLVSEGNRQGVHWVILHGLIPISGLFRARY